MKTFRIRCEKGCHGQGGIIVGPLHLEYGYDLDKLKFGAVAELDKDHGRLTVLAYFGPFQLAVGLVIWMRRRPVSPS